jgi:hypothetical protein
MRGQVPAGYVWRSASLGWEAFDSPAVPYRDCRMLPEMLVGYHRNVSAASPAGPPGAIGPAGRSAYRRFGESERRVCVGHGPPAPCLGSPRRTGERKGRNSGAKSENGGATGWLRQCRSIPRVPHLSEVTSCRIRCEFGNFCVGPECEDHLGRPPAHERPRAARAWPTPAAAAARSARRRATAHRARRPRCDSRR